MLPHSGCKYFWLLPCFVALVSCNKLVKREVLAPIAPKSNEREAAPKVEVKLYFEAFCGGCSMFIQEELRPLWEKESLRDIVNVSVYPAGNGKCTAEGDDYRCTCQHGPEECLSNQLMDCVINHYPKPETYLPFVFCFDHKTVSEAGEKCLRDSNLPTSLLQCAQGAEGRKLQAETYAATPKDHYYVPWVTLNGKHSSAAEQNLKDAVCQTYTGPKPAGCNKSLKSVKTFNKLGSSLCFRDLVKLFSSQRDVV